jgi:chemotaxis protein CheC
MKQLHLLNESQLDALQETGNIGCSHAATAVSQMVNEEVEITVPNIFVQELPQLKKSLRNISGEENKLVGVYLELTDQFLGSILFLFPYSSALVLSDLLMFQPVGTSTELTEMSQSAITEVGNVVVSAYTNALSSFLDTSIMLSPPHYSEQVPDMFLDEITEAIGKDTSHALVFDTKFKGKKNQFTSYFILLPSPQSLDILYDRLIASFGKTSDVEVDAYVNSLAE